MLDLFGGAIFIQADILRSAKRDVFVWRALTWKEVILFMYFFKYKVSVITQQQLALPEGLVLFKNPGITSKKPIPCVTEQLGNCFPKHACFPEVCEGMAEAWCGTMC